MNENKKTKDLGSMLSFLAVGCAPQEDSPQVEESVIKSAAMSIKPRKNKKPIVTLVDVDQLDLDDFDEVDQYFEAAMVGLDDQDTMVTDIAGNVDLAIDVLDDPMADLEYKNDIISAGRRYARSTSKGETSEIERAYAGNTAAILKLIREIDMDKKAIDEDIKHLRGLRSRRYMDINGAVENKNSLHNTQLQSIKELNNMTKVQFELKAKMEANDASDADAISTKALQNIFGLGRKDMIESSGGNTRVAGGRIGGYDTGSTGSAYVDGIEMDDDELERRYTTDSDSDGDIFLENESRGVEYVVEFDDNGDYDVYAEDRDGNVVDNYPLPSNIDALKFNVNKHSSIATDQLQRRYKVKYK